ncbi:MAG: hypothetical protein HOI95_18615 [Chromatiales bacterium]|jgi:hypothetical protein|nr:hypothetical protein [Chromatiales bacterium]
MVSYEKQVIALYQGELYGERLFNALSILERDAEVAAMWSLVAEVEAKTAKRLRPLAGQIEPDLDRHISLSEARVETQLKDFEGQSWRDICEYYHNRILANIARLRTIESEGPAEDKVLLGQVVAHSQVFFDCLEHWLRDERAAACDCLRAYLADDTS